MPIEDNVGLSKYPPIKQKHFKTIVNMHLSITSAVLKKNKYFNPTYHYIDATAGPGRYSFGKTKIHGSPIIFVNSAEAKNITYYADFIYA